MGRNRGRSDEPPVGVGDLPMVEVTANEGVSLIKRADGSAFFSPAVEPVAMKRLNALQRQDVNALLDHAGLLMEMQDHMRDLVDQARDDGVSWHLIGWALGLTGEGARQAYFGRYQGE